MKSSIGWARFLVFTSILVASGLVLLHWSDNWSGRHVRAAGFLVTNTNDSGAGSLRQAIIDANTAAGGDTINFDTAGAFATPQTISLSTIGDSTKGASALLVNSQITIVGPAAGVTITRGGGGPNMRLFYVTPIGNLTLQNLTLSNGLARGGDGGGLDGNNSEGGGGGGAGLGGGIFNEGILNVQSCTLTGNSAVGGNGGNGSGNLSTGGGGGGGLAGSGQDGVSGGTGGTGGGGQGGSAGSDGSPGGFGGGGGGGSFGGSCGSRGGNGGFGGGGGGGAGLACSPPNNGFGGIGGGNGGPGGSGNGGSGGGGGAGFGGAIFNNVGTLSITNSTIAGNTATGGNGGNALGSGNGGNGGDGSGGGVYNFGGIIFNGPQVRGKTAFSIGSGLTMMNSTVAGNTASAGTAGTGGSSAAGSGEGGGIYTGASSGASFRSTLIANNTAITSGPDVDSDAPVFSQGYNLVGKTDGSSGFTNPTDLTGTIGSPLNPLLDPAGLQPNGGPTKTIALQAGSPAVDKGISNGLTTDQRGAGFPRTSDSPSVGNASGGDGTDIGAFEIQSPCAPDVISPLISCPANITKFTDSGQVTASVITGNPVASDNCQLKSVVGVRSDGKALTAPYPIGVTIITWTASDASNNNASCSQSILVMPPSSRKPIP